VTLLVAGIGVGAALSSPVTLADGVTVDAGPNGPTVNIQATDISLGGEQYSLEPATEADRPSDTKSGPGKSGEIVTIESEDGKMTYIADGSPEIDHIGIDSDGTAFFNVDPTNTKITAFTAAKGYSEAVQVHSVGNDGAAIDYRGTYFVDDSPDFEVFGGPVKLEIQSQRVVGLNQN